GVRTKVLVIEQVEDLEHTVERHVARVHAFLQPRVEAVDRPADEVVTRHDAPVGAQALLRGPGGAFVAAILASNGDESLPRAVEVDATCLDAQADVPHSVEHGTMTLVAGLPEAAVDHRSRTAIVTAQVGSELEADGPLRHHAIGPQIPL